MRILVTGGAGYVGSHVVQALLEAGHEPIVFDNLSSGHPEAVLDAELVVGDIADRDKLSEVLRQYTFDGCIHLAASSLVAESVRDPSRYFWNNVVAGLTLFDSLVRADVPWVVLSSTAAVYGEPEVLPIPEEHPKRPTNAYGESKWMLERILKWYEQAYGFRYVILRYFNAAGAHPSGRIGEDHRPETHVIPLILQVALGKQEAIAVFGKDYHTPDGTAVRDYVHVCDLASAHVAAVERLCTGGLSASYNLGTQRGYSVLEVIELARQVTGRQIPVVFKPRRAGDPAVLVASSELAQRELGWTPKFDLQAILETAWHWHANHPNGYRERIQSVR